MSAVGAGLRAVGLGVVWVVSSWFAAGVGYELAPPAPPAPAAVIVTAAPAPVSYAADTVEVTVTNTGGPWALLVLGGAWTAAAAGTGGDTVAAWPVGRLEPGASRTSTLPAIPGAGGGEGPITFTVEHR